VPGKILLSPSMFLVAVVHKIARHVAKNRRIATPSSQEWPPSCGAPGSRAPGGGYGGTPGLAGACLE
jgi:hypothetical protein